MWARVKLTNKYTGNMWTCTIFTYVPMCLVSMMQAEGRTTGLAAKEIR